MGTTGRRVLGAVGIVSCCHPANTISSSARAAPVAEGRLPRSRPPVPHTTSNTRQVHRKTTIKADIGNTQLTAVIHPATKARISSGGSARGTCWLFHYLHRPQSPQKHIHFSHPSVPRWGHPVVSPRTATPATVLTNRASCPHRVIPQHPRCSHTTVGWDEICMTWYFLVPSVPVIPPVGGLTTGEISINAGAGDRLRVFRCWHSRAACLP